MAKQSWRLLAAALALLGFVTMAWAETEVDPGAVSDGLKAIFKYGPGTHETADRLNSNTVTIMTGTIAGTRHARLPGEKGLRQQHQEAIHLHHQAL